MQDYIENENGRLEREQQFWSKEIVVKIEYKYCPNLTIIDTPGAHITNNARQSDVRPQQGSCVTPDHQQAVSCTEMNEVRTGIAEDAG